MSNWADYVRRFYELPPEAQREQWEKLSAEQRKHFEAARSAAEQPPPNLPSPRTSGNQEVLNRRLGARGCLVALVAIILVFGLLAIMGSIEQHKEEERAKERARLEAEQAAMAERQLVETFQNRREEILAIVEEMIASGNLKDGLALTEKYRSSEDPDLAVLHERAKSQLEEAEQRARIEGLLSEIEKTSDANLVKKRDLYRELSELAPKEPKYKEMLGTYSRKVEERVEKARRERERDRAKRESENRERQARVNKFGEPPEPSAWDGSYTPVKRYLKQVANDPDSIEIAGCTKVYYTNKGWLVGCDYRGRNAFGGLVKQSNWFTIVHGRVIEMHEASAFQP